MFETLSKVQPIGRMAKPEEIAKLALYLCSDDSSYVTGQAYNIDGGYMSLRV
jgi:NAD(P)-dependent dehydrogenase (short-subunit alcohol dehydrogenase family)